MATTAIQSDFYYAPAFLGLLSPERASEVISTVQELVSNASFAGEVHWGAFDVWNDYNKLIVKDVSDWNLASHSGFYGFVRSASKPLRTPSTGSHYAVTAGNSFALFYDDYEHVNTDDEEWAELLHAIIDAVPEITTATEEEMNG